MAQMIFVNLPVRDLPRSVAFYEAIGCRKEPTFSNDDAAMMVLSDEIRIMLLTHGFFQQFTAKQIPDAHTTCQVLIAISRDSREAVDQIMSAALGAGGREPRPVQDMGFMYGRAFEDPDGHTFEPSWMDATAYPGAS